MLVVRGHFISSEKEVNGLRATVGTIRHQLRVAEGEATKLKKSLGEREKQVSGLNASLEEKGKQVSELEASLAEVREDAQNSKCLDQLTACAKLLKRFLDGRLTTKDARKEVDIFLASLGTEADLAYDVEAPEEDVNSTSDSQEKVDDAAPGAKTVDTTVEIVAEVAARVDASAGDEVNADDA
ncbi:uncharacterized protein LOC110718189 [Chenopodium quinoa]|uniref:uncharacterized protein LOC110718189 n=1 Tax=Chenopodium quinoa TaxID=63459 RepID=UPI000B781157|nr:uncharacterized protein LOC110718189 [Chenopodium quinoa]XP_021752692.1 uncharacterized protein LOC110718189 [Chenopodium quinoa]XP_021752693.1 uncharacterized protein LOC110718189 [Chenopodium quinoa]